MHVVVIVLGDVGRSPRMQYHALSLLQEGFDVSLVGYDGEDLIPDLVQYYDDDDTNKQQQQQLNVVRFTTLPPPQILRKYKQLLLPLYFAWRLVSLVGGLVWALWMLTRDTRRRRRQPVDCVLVQNPPAIPLLFVTYLYCQILGLVSGYNKNRRPKLIIDWHNLGYSMLRPGSAIQRLAKWYEEAMAPLADGHLCVTKAMKDFLRKDMKLVKDISVLYDCPPSMFRPLSVEEQHAFLLRLQQESIKDCCSWTKELTETQTLLTEQQQVNGKIMPRRNRPVLVTSSTSWTEDEDFGILLEALVSLDQRLDNLRVLVFVTGKGPMKAFYEEKISKLQLQHISIHTLWLAPGDYPLLLACADVGVSLHTSTSGLDLPMKILDLYGCETPVCAIDFECLDELVQDKVTGRVFSTSTELANQLSSLLSPIPERAGPHSFGDLATYSSNLKGRQRWSENWKAHALPLLTTSA